MATETNEGVDIRAAGAAAGVASDTRATEVAAEFGVALSRLQARIKQESGRQAEGFTPSQLAMLQRLSQSDGMSITQLAAAEHVSQQAITQRLALLEPTGCVEVRRDARDARRKVVVLSDEGSRVLSRVAGAQQMWLERAILAEADGDDLAALSQAAKVMERLAGSDCE